MLDLIHKWLSPAAGQKSLVKAEECKKRGNDHMSKGEFEAAAACYRQAVDMHPGYAEAHNNLGLALSHLERLDDALACFETALALKCGLVEAHLNSGNVRRRMGDAAGALSSFKEALAIDPLRADICNSLGVLLQEQGRLDDALACFNRALALEPNYVEAHNNLGTAYRLQGRVAEAAASFARAISLRSDFPEAHNNLGTIAQDEGRLKDAYAHYRQALALKPDYAEAHSNALLAVQYDLDYSAADVLAKHLEFADRFEKPLQGSWPEHVNTRDADRRLRIGFVSGDLRTHPVGFFLESVLAHLDRNSLALTLYPTNTGCDELSRRLQCIADAWQPLAGLSDDAAARRINGDGIDILIDLSGHTADNRLLVFARKPAPIQASWLYFSTTGLRSMDYVLCDSHVVLDGEERFFTEKPLRLPDSYLCFTPPLDDVSTNDLPAKRNGYITFGCFNNLTKMNDAVVRCWAQVLQAVPHSRLFLKAKQLNDPSMRRTTANRFATHGVEADRLILEGPSGRTEYLSSYSRVDIALDPFPFPGGTTTVEALWMGVPVLGRRGARFISRAGESILRTAGLSEWIADDDGDFVAKAAAFNADHQALATLRSSLRAQLLASPLCDAQRFTRNLETAFRTMWSEFVARMPMPPANTAASKTIRC